MKPARSWIGLFVATSQELLAGKMLHHVKGQATEVPFDLVIFTGDIAATGKPAEFNRASEQFLTPLKNMLSLSNDRITLVPGNHDIDRTLISKYQEPGLQSLNSTIALDSLLAEKDQPVDAVYYSCGPR